MSQWVFHRRNSFCLIQCLVRPSSPTTVSHHLCINKPIFSLTGLHGPGQSSSCHVSMFVCCPLPMRVFSWLLIAMRSLKNPVYGRHRISRPMRIVAPICMKLGKFGNDPIWTVRLDEWKSTLPLRSLQSHCRGIQWYFWWTCSLAETGRDRSACLTQGNQADWEKISFNCTASRYIDCWTRTWDHYEDHN